MNFLCSKNKIETKMTDKKIRWNQFYEDFNFLKIFGREILLLLISCLQYHSKTTMWCITYVCNEQIFDSPPFIYNKTFLTKNTQEFVVQIFMLRLAPFAFKLVNYSKHKRAFEECLNMDKSSFLKENVADFEFLQI